MKGITGKFKGRRKGIRPEYYGARDCVDYVVFYEFVQGFLVGVLDGIEENCGLGLYGIQDVKKFGIGMYTQEGLVKCEFILRGEHGVLFQ